MMLRRFASFRTLPACVPLALAAGSALGQAGAPSFTQPTSPNSTNTNPSTTPDNKPQGQSPTVDLRPKFRKGQQLRYTITIDGRNTIKSILPTQPGSDPDAPMDDPAQDQTLQQQINLVMNVTEATDTGSTVQVVYESIKMSLDSSTMGRAEFDSNAPAPVTTPNPPANQPTSPSKTSPSKATPKPAAPSAPKPRQDSDPAMNELLAQLIRPMVGTTVELKLDPNGVITSVSGGAALSGSGALSGLLSSLGGSGMGAPGAGPSTPGVPALPTSAGPGGNWLTGSASGGNAGARRIGESWVNIDNLGSTPAGAFSLRTTHTLRSASGSIANLAFTGRGESTGSTSSQSPLATGINLESAMYSGQYQWDTAQGQLREMNSELKTSMSGQIGESKVRMSSEQRVSVRRR